MLLELKGKEYLESASQRLDSINELIESGRYKCIVEELYNTKDKDEIKSILEDQLFFQYIDTYNLNRFLEGDISKDEFIEEYIETAVDGFYSFLTMLL